MYLHYSTDRVGWPGFQTVTDRPIDVVTLPRYVGICVPRFDFEWEGDGGRAFAVEHVRWWRKEKVRRWEVVEKPKYEWNK